MRPGRMPGKTMPMEGAGMVFMTAHLNRSYDPWEAF